MTRSEIVAVEKMRAAGNGYKTIAKALNLPVSTVKSHCQRHPKPQPTCPQCGSVLHQTSGHRQKRFCCTPCRMKW